MPGEELGHSSNHVEKLLSRMGNDSLVGRSSKLEFLPEFRQSKEHRFGFI